MHISLLMLVCKIWNLICFLNCCVRFLDLGRSRKFFSDFMNTSPSAIAFFAVSNSYGSLILIRNIKILNILICTWICIIQCDCAIIQNTPMSCNRMFYACRSSSSKIIQMIFIRELIHIMYSRGKSKTNVLYICFKSWSSEYVQSIQNGLFWKLLHSIECIVKRVVSGNSEHWIYIFNIFCLKSKTGSNKIVLPYEITPVILFLKKQRNWS